MSWIEKVKTEFIITTGAGKKFRPQYINTQKSIEYNVAIFEFPGLAGSLVKRGKPKGTRYNMEIYFQGDDHLETCDDFLLAAADNRPWVITHPLYGEISVQPLSLLIDNSNYNVSKITGPVVETITDDAPKGSIAPKDKILQAVETCNDSCAEAFANDVQAKAADKTEMLNNNKKFYKAGTGIAKLREESADYFNAFNAANSAVMNITSEPLAGIRLVQAMINLPSKFSENAKNRLTTLVSQFNLLRVSLVNLTRYNQKKIYETSGAAFMVALVYSAITPVPKSKGVPGDYGTRASVIDSAERLMSSYAQYLSDLDNMSGTNAGILNSFAASSSSQYLLNQLVNFTVSQLLAIAMDSRQERIVIMEDDTNIINIAHRFYGLLADDSTIDQIVSNNNIGPTELLQVKKGRKIIYYI